MYAWLANQNTGGLTQLHAIKECSVSNKDINTVLVREIRTHDINVETIRACIHGFGALIVSICLFLTVRYC